MLEDTFDRYVLPYLLLPSLFILFAVWHWLAYFGLLAGSPWVSTIMALIAVIVSVVQLFRLRRTLRAMKQGQQGEIAVGQFLDSLKAKGYKVIHDIPCGNFNIDHVVLGTRGFYAIETKTLSKPAIGSPTITPTENGLVVDGGPASTDYPEQAIRQARWLQEKLIEITGKKWPIKPVLLFPGWFVEPVRTKTYSDVWTLEPKAFPKFLANEQERISDSDVQLASSHLTRNVRYESSFG